MENLRYTWFATIILLSLQLSVYAQQISRVEPPNWWTGMENDTLQLFIYGKELKGLSAEIHYPGVSVASIQTLENTNYLALNLLISSQAHPGSFDVNLVKPNGVKELTFPYQLLAREPGSAERVGYNTTDAIYLITPDRFSNGDPGNDQLTEMLEAPNRTDKNGRHGGDIQGIANHLDYIRDMGFTALWLNPVLENNMPRYSYHGYAVTDFYKVDPRMGTNESFRQLVKDCKQKGIKMIMDMIHNHCGSNHWWMQDLPSKDWINYTDQPYTETNHQKTLHPDPYAATKDIRVLEEGWFVRTMPDLNVTNPILATYLIQNSIWWIEYAGLAGIRMDTYLYPESHYMAKWVQAVLTEYPDFQITGEVWETDPALIAYWQKDKINQDGYVSPLPSLFDFPIQKALVESLNTTPGHGDPWMPLYEMLARDFQYPDPTQLVVFPDNHDMTRLFTQINEDLQKVKMALAYSCFVRGIPQLFYGTEILMTSPKDRDDGLVRSDFPGGWSGDEISAFSQQGLTPPQREIQDFTKQLLNWRKTASVIHHGKTTHFLPHNQIYVMVRLFEEDMSILVLNRQIDSQTIDLQQFIPKNHNFHHAKNIFTRQESTLDQPITLSGPGAYIFELRK